MRIVYFPALLCLCVLCTVMTLWNDVTKLHFLDIVHRMTNITTSSTSKIAHAMTSQVMTSSDGELKVTTVTESTDPEDWMRRMEALFDARRAHINDTCCKYGRCLDEGETPHKHDFYSDTYQYTICWIEKCSYSSWLRATLVSDGIYLPNETVVGAKAISRGAMHTVGRLDPQRAQATWSNYTNIILVRHPFERIVSAFNDKMSAKQKSPFYSKLSKTINRKFRRFRSTKRARLASDNGLATFEDFVNYLVRLGPPSKRDDHWKQYESICDPCRSNYDVIMKFDTFDDDFRYMKRYLNVSEYHLPAFFPPRKTNTNTDMTAAYFATIPLTLRRKLFVLYSRDFELFGYEIPPYLRH